MITKFEYEQKTHILEVDGKEYKIPGRTAAIEKQLKEHDAKLSEMTEYEANMLTVEILFGKEGANAMFPEGEEGTNLDKLAKVVKYALALYMAEITAIKAENTKEQLKELEPIMKPIRDISNVLKNADTKKFVANNKK